MGDLVHTASVIFKCLRLLCSSLSDAHLIVVLFFCSPHLNAFSTLAQIFLAWPVPNCEEGCPSNWIGDKAGFLFVLSASIYIYI